MTEKLDLEAIEARCEAASEWLSCDGTYRVYMKSIADTRADLSVLVAEARRLQTDLAAEHALMIMYSDRCAAVRRKLQEVGAIARHEEITNLDAIIRLAEAGKEL